MSDEIRKIVTSVGKLAGTFKSDPVTMVWGTVKSVDEKKATCNVVISNDVEVPDVTLQTAICDGWLLVPSVDSNVVLLKSVNGPNSLIIQTSDLDKIIMQVGDAGFTIWNKTQNGGQIMQLNDGSFGGLLKLIDPDNTNAGVLARLNILEKKVNDIILFESTHTHPVAGAVANASTNPAPQQLTETQRADIENKLITHGK